MKVPALSKNVGTFILPKAYSSDNNPDDLTILSTAGGSDVHIVFSRQDSHAVALGVPPLEGFTRKVDERGHLLFSRNFYTLEGTQGLDGAFLVTYAVQVDLHDFRAIHFPLVGNSQTYLAILVNRFSQTERGIAEAESKGIKRFSSEIPISVPFHIIVLVIR